MEFRANHGCGEDERKKGNRFTVDFMAEIDVDKAAKTDNLADTVDLAEIYSLAAKEMARPSNLIENVAARIVRAVEKRYPKLEHFSIRVSKQNPPVVDGGLVEWSRITMDGGCAKSF